MSVVGDQLLMGPFRARPGVVGVRVRNNVVLLDRTTERYLTLNDVAGDIWEQLMAGASLEAITDRICSDYDVARERVSADVAAQVAELLRGGLIEFGVISDSGSGPKGFAPEPAVPASAGTPAPADIDLPSHFRCALVIAEVKSRLALHGYDRVLWWVRRRVQHKALTTNASLATVRAAEQRVAMTAAFYPGRARCLEQSLTLYLLLRLRGIDARYRQGVKPHPFEAHAWIEYHGEVINDVDEHVKHFALLPDQLP